MDKSRKDRVKYYLKGLCRCGRPRQEARNKCSFCLQKDREYRRKKYKERVNNGVCQYCGYPLNPQEKEAGLTAHTKRICPRGMIV